MLSNITIEMNTPQPPKLTCKFTPVPDQNYGTFQIILEDTYNYHQVHNIEMLWEMPKMVWILINHEKKYLVPEEYLTSEHINLFLLYFHKCQLQIMDMKKKQESKITFEENLQLFQNKLEELKDLSIDLIEKDQNISEYLQEKELVFKNISKEWNLLNKNLDLLLERNNRQIEELIKILDIYRP